MMRGLMESIPPEHLLLVARTWLFDMNTNETNVDIHKALKSAADRGNLESAWLLDKLPPNNNINVLEKFKLIAEIMCTEDNPWGWYYRGRATCLIGRDGYFGLELLRKSANADFLPAIYCLSYCSVYEQERNVASVKSIDLEYPDALFFCRDFNSFYKAATKGHVKSMRGLLYDYIDRLTNVEKAMFGARCLLLNGKVPSSFRQIVTGGLRLLDTGTADTECLTFLRTFGRELNGYSDLWITGKHPDSHYLQCIDVYLTMRHRARRSALQTVVVLSRFLGRDVARMIGKMVYESS